MTAANPGLGLSGLLARSFQAHPLMPVLALAGLLLGLFATLVTPREEEPQIDVTMADVFVPFAGATAGDVADLVTMPLQQVLSEIDGVKHVYSVSRPGLATITVEFRVGVPRQDAIVRLYNQVYSHADLWPAGLGVGQPLLRPMGIDDVPVMALTLWTDDPERDAVDLARVAHTLESELKRVPGTRDVYTLGAPERAVIVELDASRLSAYGLTVDDLAAALAAANLVSHAGDRIDGSGSVPLTAGTWLADAQEIAMLVVGRGPGGPLRLSDVADIRSGADLPASHVWHMTRSGAPDAPATGEAPAVTLAIAKQPGRNAADITTAIGERLAQLRNTLLPDGVQVEITRDYGASATDKAMTLIRKLLFATASVVLLVLLALGWREAVVVGCAVVLTLALTLFASWAMGFTLNRVSLFALIFAIGILVDDAIVVVENIHRHLRLRGQPLLQAIPPAVDEVGRPTILATFTVIAALLPMAFVSGLMGPYMRPIPVNASVGMLLSLLIALTVTPWLARMLLAAAHGGHDGPAAGPRLQGLFARLLKPFLAQGTGTRARRLLYAGMALLVALAVALVGLQWVVMKMLPFDNKSEFQVVVDLPEGRRLEDTDALLKRLAATLLESPDVLSVQGYAGTSAPINFNGLVRQYYQRRAAHLGDLQVNLRDRRQRSRQSHDIARALRPALAAIAVEADASLRVVEVPPGPPVLAPLVAEIYGPDLDLQQAIGIELQNLFAATDGIVDVDSTVEADAPREALRVDRERAARLGIGQQQIAQLLSAALSGQDATYLHDGASRHPVPVRLRMPASDQADLQELLALRVRGSDGGLVALSELVDVQRVRRDQAIHHKDLLPVVRVMADEAGHLDSPLYGMARLAVQIAERPFAGVPLAQHLLAPPAVIDGYALKWDGEWQITYETFRDMGIAYAVGLLLIYLLVVAQFRSYLLPLLIMAPIPLTVIGVLPGHALLGAQFTATSMIGMIALAGIIVRNSILLVDFIQQTMAQGRSAAEAVVEACAVRAQPIVLTALAAMAGAFFILDDPIFNGLAISLIFGIGVSTLLTLVVIPLLYYGLLRRRPAAPVACG